MKIMPKKETKNKESRELKQPPLRAPRFNTLARVSINGFEGEAVLKNISVGGFCMESRTYAAITPGERYIMRILPESSFNLSPFELEVEGRWVQSTEKKFSSGFLIAMPPPNRALEKYIEQIQEHSPNH
jgi:hypothetical protein